MFRNSRWLQSGLLATALSFSACKAPEGLEVAGTIEEPWIINWDNTSAMGLYVTSPDAQIPSGPRQKVKGGVTYWVLEATGFPDGFENPVTYGVVPKKAKDATVEHGGPAGGAALQCGIEYKVSVVSLGGNAEIFASWECPMEVNNAP